MKKPDQTPPAADARELVVLLHGLNRTHRSMSRIANALERDGLRTLAPSYPSSTMPFEQIASEWLPSVLAKNNTAAAPRVHFVTHSMGGIVVRLWLHLCTAPKNIGCVVMIAPPNRGSEVPDRLRNNPLFRFITGVNGHRLGTDPDSVPNQLAAFPEKIALGVIAGNSSLNPVFSAWINGPSDGTLSVASTHLAGMRDHVVMPHSHTGILLRSAVCKQVKNFLRTGQFARA